MASAITKLMYVYSLELVDRGSDARIQVSKHYSTLEALIYLIHFFTPLKLHLASAIEVVSR